MRSTRKELSLRQPLAIRRRVAWALGLVMVAQLVAAQTASAATCGGALSCNCGDTVTASAVLDRDLGICTGEGLRLANGVTLDCAGHTITGSDQPGAWYGIVLDEVAGATVRNCKVTKFRRGLRVRGGSSNRLLDNDSSANNYGIDVAGGATDTRIERNVMRDNRDEGIHVGTDADRTVIASNQVLRSKLENIYLLEADDCVVRDNQVAGGGAAAIFIKHSQRNQIDDNVVSDGPIQVRGRSTDNSFSGNRLTREGYIFEAYQDAVLGWTHPHDNLVDGGSIISAATCFQFLGAFDNQARNVTADRCLPMTNVERGGVAATGNSVSLIPTFRPSGDRSYPLDVDLTDRVDPVRPGEQAVYEVDVENFTVASAPDVVVTSRLAPGTTFVAAHRAPDFAPIPALILGDRVELALGTVEPCDLPSLPRCRDIWITVQLDPTLAQGSVISHQVDVRSSNATLFPANSSVAFTSVGSMAVRDGSIQMGKPGRDRVRIVADLARAGRSTPSDPMPPTFDPSAGVHVTFGEVGGTPLIYTWVPPAALRCTTSVCKLQPSPTSFGIVGLDRLEIRFRRDDAQRNNSMVTVSAKRLTLSTSISPLVALSLETPGASLGDQATFTATRSGQLRYRHSQADP